MSFITDIVEFGLGKLGIEANSKFNGIANQILGNFRGELASSTLNPVNKFEPQPTNLKEISVKTPMSADPENRIPVIYGTGAVSGHITDAVLTNNGCTMWFCVTVCEKTGIRPSFYGFDSVIYFEEIWVNDKKIGVGYDGVSVTGSWDYVAQPNFDLNLKMKVYCYNNGSESPTFIRPQGHTVTHGPAYNYMPGWTVNHQMSGLVFALVRVDYDAGTEVTGIGNMRFVMRNTMDAPGDCLYDFMTNTRYGAGIPVEEIDI